MGIVPNLLMTLSRVSIFLAIFLLMLLLLLVLLFSLLALLQLLLMLILPMIELSILLQLCDLGSSYEKIAKVRISSHSGQTL